MHAEWRKDGFLVSTDPGLLDRDTIHRWLAEESYWAAGIPRDVFERGLAHSIPFGLYDGAQLAGFARVTTDRATVAYVGDVFVLPAWRGRGLAPWLMGCVAAHPELQGLRRWILLTRDAHTLYEKSGFHALAAPERWMERHDPRVYERPAG